MHATYEGNIPIMKMLLKHGADKDAKDNEGITVLMQACDRRSQLEAAQLLIDEGADIEARVHKGRFVVGRQAGRQATLVDHYGLLYCALLFTLDVSPLFLFSWTSTQ